MSEVGDLGRRVAERRRELGLTVDQVAARSGMSATYLRVVESNPAPQLSRAALWKLAAAPSGGGRALDRDRRAGRPLSRGAGT